jgi:hypothetical protein
MVNVTGVPKLLARIEVLPARATPNNVSCGTANGLGLRVIRSKEYHAILFLRCVSRWIPAQGRDDVGGVGPAYISVRFCTNSAFGVPLMCLCCAFGTVLPGLG